MRTVCPKARFWALVALCSGAALLGQPSRASACGASPDPLLTIAETWPVDGQRGIPIDAALVIRVDDWSYGEPIRMAVTPDNLSVSVTAVDGTEAAGELRQFGSQLVWRPASELRADTEYDLQAAIQHPLPLPDGVMGAREVSVRFMTGAQRLAPLALDVASTEIVYELYDATVATCVLGGGHRLVGKTADNNLHPTGPCTMGEVCKEAGTQPMPHVRVEIGAVSGGQEDLGYEIAAQLTDRVPYRFGGEGDRDSHEVLLGDLVRVSPGMPSTLTFDLPEEDAEYTACIAIQIRDATGSVYEPEPVCDRSWNDLLDEKTQSAAAAGGAAPRVNVDAGARTHDDPSPTRRFPAMFRESCAASGIGAGRNGWLLPIAALIAARAIRKRSHKRARPA